MGIYSHIFLSILKSVNDGLVGCAMDFKVELKKFSKKSPMMTKVSCLLNMCVFMLIHLNLRRFFFGRKKLIFIFSVWPLSAVAQLPTDGGGRKPSGQVFGGRGQHILWLASMPCGDFRFKIFKFIKKFFNFKLIFYFLIFN